MAQKRGKKRRREDASFKVPKFSQSLPMGFYSNKTAKKFMLCNFQKGSSRAKMLTCFWGDGLGKRNGQEYDSGHSYVEYKENMSKQNFAQKCIFKAVKLAFLTECNLVVVLEENFQLS